MSSIRVITLGELKSNNLELEKEANIVTNKIDNFFSENLKGLNVVVVFRLNQSPLYTVRTLSDENSIPDVHKLLVEGIEALYTKEEIEKNETTK